MTAIPITMTMMMQAAMLTATMVVCSTVDSTLLADDEYVSIERLTLLIYCQCECLWALTIT